MPTQQCDRNGLLFRALRPRMRRFLLLEIVYINRLALAESAKA